LEICEGHALFDVEENKYMTYYGSEFNDQIGQEFLSVNSNSPTGFIKTTLVDVSIENQYIETFTPISENNLNVIAEGMLTMPDDIEGILEFYNFNSNYMFDLNYINDEVNKYGLYEYKDFKNIMPEYLFNALNFEMFRVYIRKGLLSYTDVNYYLDRWLEQIITFNNLDWDISNRIPMGPEHV
jgi:hypothetical protein